MEILLDTNFIIACAKKGINYDAVMNGLTTEEVKWIVPEEVLRELKGLRMGDKIRVKERDAIDLGIHTITELGIEVIKLSDTKSDVDTKIVNYLKNTDIVLATLDKALKKRVKNRILTVRGKKMLELV